VQGARSLARGQGCALAHKRKKKEKSEKDKGGEKEMMDKNE